MKNTLLKFLRVVAMVPALATATPAADYQIVASKDVTVDEISAADLKKIFLVSKTSLGSGHVTPVLQKGGPVHQAFVKGCLGESDQDLQDYYKNLVFTGKAVAPRAVASDAELIAFVALSKGAIGYVSATAIPVGVKKLTVK
jgi:hypothetical protein